MKKLQSTWLSGEEIRKDAGGLGRVIAGPSIGSVIVKLAETVLICKNGHATTLAAAKDNGRCALPKCGQKLAVKADDGDADDEMPKRKRMKEDDESKAADDDDADDEMPPQERDKRGVARAHYGDDDEVEDAKRKATKAAMIEAEVARLEKMYTGPKSAILKQARQNVEKRTTTHANLDSPRTWVER